MRQYAALLERRVQSSTRVRKAQVVTRQTKHIRNLLPQCASDATGFLSDVYKKSTRARKFLADGVQYGRSMIEMLGVLAIIGVLSVAGIAGYSKAMAKWKINKTIEQIEQITHGIFTVYANQKKMDNIYSNEEDDINLMKSLGIISEDMIKDDNELRDEYDNRLKNPFGGDLWLYTNSYYSNAQWEQYHKNEKNVSVEYYNIPREACMALGSLDWVKGSAAVIGVGIAPNDDNVHTDPTECWLENYLTIDGGDWLVVCNNGVPNEEYGETEADRIPLPIPLDIVAEHCNCKDNDCYFGVAFTDK